MSWELFRASAAIRYSALDLATPRAGGIAQAAGHWLRRSRPTDLARIRYSAAHPEFAAGLTPALYAGMMNGGEQSSLQQRSCAPALNGSRIWRTPVRP